MSRDKNIYIIYLSFVLFLTFVLTTFKFTVTFGHLISGFLSIINKFPNLDMLIYFNYLLLLSLLLLLYRRWNEERKRRKGNEETLLSLKKAIETMQIGVTITDPQGKILYINAADAEMHGYTAEELLGKDARILGPQDIWKPFFQPVLKRFRRETINIRKDGTSFPVQLMSDVVATAKGTVFALITTCEDITERRNNEERIKQLAFYDTMTGLPNRALFNDRLCQELAKARRRKGLVSVIFIDLDRFKIVNDTLGHSTGDLLLKEVSKRLKKIIREGDTACRLGGDEFVMLITDVNSRNHISAVASKIVDKLSEVFLLDGTEVFITASVGISFFPENGDIDEILIKKADAAMYYAKEQGRNNFQFYDSAIDAAVVKKAGMLGDLRRALKQKEILFHYQPRLDLATGEIAAAEALARWRHPEYGLVGPEEFIPLAEEAGIIDSIGEFLLFTACAQNKAWQDAGFPPIRISVNISTHQMLQDGFIDLLKKILNEVPLDPQFLELEFTESIITLNPEMITSKMEKLTSLGIQCSIDAFGTGYSSLNYLKYLPVNRLKIDKSFIASLTKNLHDDAISRAVIIMSHELNLKVTAEGVENFDQLEFLCSHGCDEAQGYLFSRPLPASEFVGFFKRKKFNMPEKKNLLPVLNRKNIEGTIGVSLENVNSVV